MRRKVASIEACVEVIRFYAHEGRESVGCKNKKRKQNKKEWLAIGVEEKSVHFSSQYLFSCPWFLKHHALCKRNSERFNARQTMRNRNVLSSVFKCKIADWDYLLWHGKSRGGGKKFGFNNDDACGDPGIVLGAEENAMEFKLGGFFMLGIMLLTGGLQSQGNENT